jgi:hypothetical protein
MIVELFFGAGVFVVGLVAANAGMAIIGLFFVLLVIVELVPAWLRRELRLWRRVVRHEDLNQVGLERVDDRRIA